MTPEEIVRPISPLSFAKRDIPVSEYKGNIPTPSPTMIVWSCGKKYEVANPAYNDYLRIISKAKQRGVVL